MLVEHVFRLHGIPVDIVSDRGPQFISQVWKSFCNALGAKVSLSSGFHPQTNGQTERANQDLEAALRCVAAQNQSSWSSHLHWVEYAHNSLPSSATGLTPFECSLGYLPPLFPAQETEIAVPSVQALLRSGETPELHYYAPLPGTARLLTGIVSPLQTTPRGRRFGFRLRTFL